MEALYTKKELQIRLEQSNLPAAQIILDKLLLDNPEDLDLKFANAQLMLRRGEIETSIYELLSILKVSPQAIKVIKVLSFAFLKIKMLGPALACQSRLAQLIPMDTEINKTKVSIYEFLVQKKNRDLVSLQLNIQSQVCSVSQDIKVIILCGGDSSRWRSYLGVKQKQLAPIMGEVLLLRTIRQIRTYTQGEIKILIKHGDTADYQVVRDEKNIVLCQLEKDLNDHETPATKYLMSSDYWNRAGGTVLLLGDVWFSDESMKKIFEPSTNLWVAFGRYGRSSFTGYPYGNFFGIRLLDHEVNRKSLKILDGLYRARICKAHGAGWAWTQLNRDEDPNLRSPGLNFIDIDDFTDDFDHPSDYDRWTSHYINSKL